MASFPPHPCPLSHLHPACLAGILTLNGTTSKWGKDCRGMGLTVCQEALIYLRMGRLEGGGSVQWRRPPAAAARLLQLAPSPGVEDRVRAGKGAP